MASMGSLGLAVLAAGVVCLSSGCSAVGYLAQSAAGHLELLASAQPVAGWLADERTPESVKQQLRLTQRLRDYAVSTLALPDNRSYRSYADLHRSAAVWNVVAAPELSLQLKTWCFPVVGCVGYTGYFDLAAAEAAGQALRDEGWEVSVYPVPAYSTLGYSEWLGGDPLLSSFLSWPEGELARLIFHELSHQVVYVAGDTDFNESYATAVERLGGARWLSEQAGPAAREQYQRLDGRRADFRALTLVTRERLKAIYANGAAPAQQRVDKAEAMAALRTQYEQLKRERWGGFSGYDAYMARANNASFGVQAAYTQWVPAFEALHEREARDFTRFHAAVRRLAALPREERVAALRALLP
jgi:predicted aminopeptidase